MNQTSEEEEKKVRAGEGELREGARDDEKGKLKAMHMRIK